MSGLRWSGLGAAALLAFGCEKPPRTLPVEEARTPVVTMVPVPTRPYEEGYDAGFALGKAQAAPKAKAPEPEEVRRLARQQADGHADRTERWERGFVEGYGDGFRNVVTGQK